ncbi:MAG: diaminopimelate decarboxylase [Planctomycetes bacterium]|nr:diaminopimelate decarboxylase [Planctomycetota bacterium]
MNEFSYRNGTLYAENVPVKLLAEKFGTPLYIYSKNHFLGQFNAIKKAFAELNPVICYAMKANANFSIMQEMAKAGAGVDTVSLGEIARAIKAGADPKKIVFAGVGKRDDEIEYALDQDILMFTVESEPELDAINAVAAKRKKVAPVALRINPDVDPKTHKHISTGKRENKFGIDIARAQAAIAQVKGLKNLKLLGLHMHIGSQITEFDKHGEAIDKVSALVKFAREQGMPLEYLDVGGGYGIAYKPEQGVGPGIEEFAKNMIPRIKATGLKLVMEPGRYICGNGGILVTSVIYDKPSGDKNFLVVDAAMNDLIRPSIYEAYHKIWPVNATTEVDAALDAKSGTKYDVVGPICESTDFLAKERMLPKSKRGDLLAVFSAGAYGYAMASTYNQRPRVAEIVVDGKNFWLARQRETLEDLTRADVLKPQVQTA